MQNQHGNETSEQEAALRNALGAANDRYELTMEEEFPFAARLSFDDHAAFQALAVPDGNGVRVYASSGIVDAVREMWRRSMAHSGSLPAEDRLNVGDVEQAIEASLMWLMLHELHHCNLGHFTLSGANGIAETSLDEGFGLTARSKKAASPLDQLAKEQRALFRQCMELQADHDATEMTLDTYSTDGWEIIRFYAAAIFTVMVVIEREERKNGASDEPSDYPLAATRIFQLLAHLGTMWMPLPSEGPEAMPSDDEIKAFHNQVVVPSLADVYLIATANDAQSVLDTLGHMDDFIHDMRLLQSPDQADMSKLKTTGAREYAALAPVNAQVIQLLDPAMFSR